MDLTPFINAALGAAGGAGTVGSLVLAMYRHNLKQEQQQRDADRLERARLSEKLERLENEKIAGLTKKVDEHIAADRSQEILTKLDNVAGMVNKLADSTTRALELNARQEATLAGHDIWLRNLNQSLQEHVTNHPKGGSR